MLQKIRTKIYDIREKIKYHKYKKCSIPYFYYDKKSANWVLYNRFAKKFNVSQELLDIVGDISNTGVTYHYKIKAYGRNNNSEKMKYQELVTHAHSFDRVIRELYEYPESFNIPKEFHNEYSMQELTYLNRAQKYFKLIGLKDNKVSPEIEVLNETFNNLYYKANKNIKDKIKLFLMFYSSKWRKINEKDNLIRCNNKLAFKYQEYFNLTLDDKLLESLNINEIEYLIYRKYGFNFTQVGIKYLVSDKSGNYRATIEIIEEKIIKFKELKANMIDYKKRGYKTFREYKDFLYNKYKDTGAIFNETFSEDSLISYEKFKVLEIFD